MSCEFPPSTISRCAIAFVFIVVAAPSTAFSQSADCHPIRRGETAMSLARRLTGDSRNAYQPWFQIMDASSRFIPKSQYDRIQRGWRGCIVKEATESPVALDAPAVQVETPAPIDITTASQLLTSVDVPVGTPQPTHADVVGSMSGVDLRLLWLAAALLLPLLGWRVLDDYARRRDFASIVMQQFGRRFVREFERPLIQHTPERPVRSRLRLNPARSRMEILLAPGQGRRYPNLSDHKSNLEYDVVRVQRLIADDAFERGQLHVNGGWIVIPFRFKVDQKKRTGVA